MFMIILLLLLMRKFGWMFAVNHARAVLDETELDENEFGKENIVESHNGYILFQKNVRYSR